MVGRDHGEGHVILSTGSSVARASTHADAFSDEDLWVDVGCLSKLATATIFFAVFGDEPGILNTTLGDNLDIHSSHWISSVTIEQLLCHTHGIDEPGGWKLPIDSNGFIDVDDITRAIGERPIAIPGTFYSYSAVGYWLLAAILERHTSLRFTELVMKHFPTRKDPEGGDTSFCPAYGGSIHLSAERFLLKLVRATSLGQTTGQRLVRLGSGLTHSHPAWHPTEKGVCLGWKAYGKGWYGHKTAFVVTWNILVQVSPADGIGVLICTRDMNPWKFIVAAISPDMIQPPKRPQSPTSTCGLGLAPQDQSEITGVYDRLDSRIEVYRLDRGLAIRAISKVKGTRQGIVHSAALQPLTARQYAVVPAIPFLNLHIVEFISDQTGLVSHLWNTGRLWPKTARSTN